MQKRFVRTSTLAAAVARHGPGYGEAVERCIVEREADGVWLDPAHDGYAAAREIREGIAIAPADRLGELSAVPWPQRGALIWAKLWTARNPSPSLIDAVRPLVQEGGCRCRSHFEQYLKANPPIYGDGWPEWLGRFHNAVNRSRRVAEWPLENQLNHWRGESLDTFQRCVVISLKRTPDRLKDFWRRFPRDWRFRFPEVFDAIDGTGYPVPDGWNWVRCNDGAVGCWASWMEALRVVITDGVFGWVLFMEDDCQLVDGAPDRMLTTIRNAPADAEVIFFGGEHNQRPSPHSRGLVRVNETGRTHCLAVHSRYFEKLRSLLDKGRHHVDWILRAAAKQQRYYSIDPFVAIQGANYSTLMNRYEPARAWDSRVKMPNTAEQHEKFCHHGDVGDILSSLPALRAASASFGGGKLFICPAGYTRQKMSAEIVESVRSLLELQPYIKSVEFTETPQGFALDGWRGRSYPRIYSLADRALDLVQANHNERNVGWLDVQPRHTARVIFARSPRYRHPKFPWKRIVEKYCNEAAFVGLRSEYDEFVATWGYVPWAETKTYLEMAEVLAGAELVFVNQTSTYWVAEALKKTIVLEQAPDVGNWNCQHKRDGLTWADNGSASLPDLKRLSFSQYGEDDWIFQNLNLPRSGVFVDVGAHDGRTGSNSLAFERRGWRGLCVEPDLRQTPNLEKRTCSVELCAVASTPADAVPFHLHPTDGWAGLLRTDGETVDVPTVRLEALLARHSIEHVDMLSIDTEGTELDVWASLGSFPRPSVVIVEHDTAEMADQSFELLRTFEAEGYRMIHRTSGNFIFSRL